MGCKFFDKQRVDTAGILAVRLEKLLIIHYFLSFIYVGVQVYSMLHFRQFTLFPFIFIGIAWFVWYLGWKGATQRRTGCLTAYFVFTLIGAILQVVGFFMTSVGGSLVTVLLLNNCASDTGCSHFVDAKNLLNEYPWIITAIFVFSIIVFIFPLFLNVIGLFLSMAVKKELRAIQRNAIQTLNLQEEGCCKADDSCPQQEQQQQQPELAAPVFYTMPQQPSFAPQGYMPVPVVTAEGATPTVVYIPYPTQQESIQQ